MLERLLGSACPFAFHGDERITYSVLESIVKDPCQEIWTDRKDVMICLSAPPYPVWVFCRDEGDEAVVREIAACLRARFPLEAGHRYNLSESLLARLAAADAAFAGARVQMRLLSYRLDKLAGAAHPCDGRMTPARMDELETLARLHQAATLEMEHREFPLAHCRERVREMIEAGCLFLWRDERGETVCMTCRHDGAPFSRLTLVYTLPEHRRRGYAANLVHGVTQTILADGLTPILYADADYVASNACYRKLGFDEVGRLCTVAKG